MEEHIMMTNQKERDRDSDRERYIAKSEINVKDGI